MTYQGYLSWVDAWMRAESGVHAPNEAISEDDAKKIIHGEAETHLLYATILKFRHNAEARILGTHASVPSSPDTDLLFGDFDPRTACSCNGLSPTTQEIDSHEARTFSKNKCHAIDRLWQGVDMLRQKHSEWNGRGLFTTEKLQSAAEALVLINTGLRSPAKTCYSQTVENVRAPDRKRNNHIDSSNEVYIARFPTFEKIKLCSDAKYFFSIACGISQCNKGLSRAVSDAANDILIGDYAEAADEESMKLLQSSGAAAFAFLKLCHISGDIDGWHLDIMTACSLHFRVLSYYRDHARPTLADGIYGSGTDSLTAHRIIDMGIAPPIVIASLVSGEKITEEQYHQLCYATVLVNDLIDLRSDAMRKQRENPILRGMSENLCEYLGRCMRDCIVAVTQMINHGKLTALVILGSCNWMLMSSHHKVYETIAGVEEFASIGSCSYGGAAEYNELLKSLEPFGTSKDGAPDVRMKRAELENRYCRSRQSTEGHLAWLADVARTLLHPHNLRMIIDIGHYRWTGNLGDAEFCP